MSKWKFTYIYTNVAITRQKATTQWLVLLKDKDAQQSWAIAVDIAGATSAAITRQGVAESSVIS